MYTVEFVKWENSLPLLVKTLLNSLRKGLSKVRRGGGESGVVKIASKEKRFTRGSKNLVTLCLLFHKI